VVFADVGTQPERAQESLDVLVAELHRISTPSGAVTPEEFHRAVAGMKSRLIFSGESTGGRASALAGDVHRLGRPRSLDEVAAVIDGISLERLNAYLSSRSLGRVTVQTVGPAPLAPPAGTA
jgi:predicted Zn-dependent peptidase